MMMIRALGAAAETVTSDPHLVALLLATTGCALIAILAASALVGFVLLRVSRAVVKRRS